MWKRMVASIVVAASACVPEQPRSTSPKPVEENQDGVAAKREAEAYDRQARAERAAREDDTDDEDSAATATAPDDNTARGGAPNQREQGAKVDRSDTLDPFHQDVRPDSREQTPGRNTEPSDAAKVEIQNSGKTKESGALKHFTFPGWEDVVVGRAPPADARQSCTHPDPDAKEFVQCKACRSAKLAAPCIEIMTNADKTVIVSADVPTDGAAGAAMIAALKRSWGPPDKTHHTYLERQEISYEECWRGPSDGVMFVTNYYDLSAVDLKNPNARVPRAQHPIRILSILTPENVVVCDDARAASAPPVTTPSRPPQNVAPATLEALRISGNKLIEPDSTTKTAIQASGRNRVIGSFKMCLTAEGAVDTVSPLKSTGFPAYDQTIMGRIGAEWRYRPFMLDGRAVPVCTAVTFIFSQT